MFQFSYNSIHDSYFMIIYSNQCRKIGKGVFPGVLLWAVFTIGY